jgi:hypothetical protein
VVVSILSLIPASPHTGELTFIRCSFHSNFGAQIYCQSPNDTDNVFFHDCSIKAESPPNPWDAKGPIACIQAAENGVMENCYIDLGPYDFALSPWKSFQRQKYYEFDFIYR